MKLFIVGANGKTGQHMVRQALAAGHEVTTFVRHQGWLNTIATNPQLTIVIADVIHDHEKLELHLAGHDVVLSALGNGLLVKGNGGPKIMNAAMTNIVRAMHVNNIKRIGLMLSYGSGETERFANIPIRLLAKTLLRKDFADLAAAEKTVTTSDVDWTISYFGSLTDDSLSRKYTLSTTLTTPRVLVIPRADVAHFLLDATTHQKWCQQRVVLSGPKKELPTVLIFGSK